METTTPDNTDRFSGRVDSYAKYRRGYPPESLAEVVEYFKLSQNGTKAYFSMAGNLISLHYWCVRTDIVSAKMLDLGAGTGILTAQLLSHFPSATVTAVEPNNDMRNYILSAPTLTPHIQSEQLSVVEGTAEKTNLPDNSMDVIFAAAAFHWFDGPRARSEVLRIGRECNIGDGESGIPFIILTHGKVADAEAERHADGDANFVDPRWGADGHWRAFNDRVRQRYEELNINYTAQVRDIKLSKDYLSEFFGHNQYKVRRSDGSREMGLESLKGGLDSYSSLPRKDSPQYDFVVGEVTKLFDAFQRGGKVKLVRDQVAYYGLVR